MMMRHRFWLNTFLGLGVGLFFLYWMFRQTSLVDLEEFHSRVDPRFLLMGIGSYFCGSLVRTLRWRRLLQPFIALPFKQVLSVLIVGSAMNLLLPARLGEIIRINLCKKWYELSRSTVLGTILWERVTDGITVILCLLLGMFSIETLNAHQELKGLAWLGSGIFVSAAIVLFFLSKKNISWRKFPKIQKRVKTFQEDLQKMASSGIFFLIVTSIAVWTCEGLSVWCMVRAIGWSLELLHACLLVGVVSLSTLLPSAPGFLGTLQFAFGLALQVAGYPLASGIFCATLYQVFIGGALVLVGLSVWGAVSWCRKRDFPESLREIE